MLLESVITNRLINFLRMTGKAVIDVNFTRAFNICKAITPLMKMCGSGRIMNIAILGGRTGRPGVGINYAASKAGLIGLTQALARELSPWRIN